MRRGVLLKDLDPADLVIALDAYRDDTGLEPAASLEGVKVGYVKRLSWKQELALASVLPWEWVLKPANVTDEQLGDIIRRGKFAHLGASHKFWPAILEKIERGERGLLLHNCWPSGGAQYLTPRRVFEASVLGRILTRTVSRPETYFVDLGRSPDAFLQPPKERQP